VQPLFLPSTDTSSKSVFDALVSWRKLGLALSANVANPRDNPALSTIQVKGINREMGRLRLVVHAAERQLSAEERDVWQSPQPDDATTGGAWSDWYTATQGVCRTMELKLLASIKDRERVVKEAKEAKRVGEGVGEGGGEANGAGKDGKRAAGTAGKTAGVDKTTNTVSAVSSRLEKLAKEEKEISEAKGQTTLAPASAGAKRKESSEDGGSKKKQKAEKGKSHKKKTAEVKGSGQPGRATPWG
jgi:hypothetical protein